MIVANGRTQCSYPMVVATGLSLNPLLSTGKMDQSTVKTYMVAANGQRRWFLFESAPLHWENGPVQRQNLNGLRLG